MSTSALMLKRNYWIAGIGAIVAALSFLAFTFLYIGASISVTYPGYTFPTYDVPASPATATQLASYSGVLWVSFLLVLGALGAAITFMVRPTPFGSNVPAQKQSQWVAYGFIGAGALGAIFMILGLVLLQQSAQAYLASDMQSVTSFLGSDYSSYFHFNLNISWGFGAYAFLLGLLTIVAAGVLELIQPTKLVPSIGMAGPWNYPQNQYGAPSAPYGMPPANPGAQPYVDPSSQYGAANPYQGQAYPPVTDQPPPAAPYQPPVTGQPPAAAPYQPPAQYPPYGQQ